MNELIPFGKYKGQPLEVLASDKKYLEWLQNQEWFRSQYPTINTLIINNFQDPSETPEHNKLQAMFTDDDLCKKLVDMLGDKSIDETYSILENGKWITPTSWDIEIFGCRFEQSGVDVIINYGPIYIMSGKKQYSNTKQLLIELKPSVGDDYPAILRQMHSNNSKILITEKYNGVGATYEQFKKIFAASGIKVLLLSEIL